jgi:hypothetical protein
MLNMKFYNGHCFWTNDSTSPLFIDSSPFIHLWGGSLPEVGPFGSSRWVVHLPRHSLRLRFMEHAHSAVAPVGGGASWRRNHRRGGSMEFKVGTLFLKTKTKTPISIGHSTSATVNSPSIILSRQWRDSGARMKQSLGRQKLVRPRDSSLTVTNTVVKWRFGAVPSYRKMIGSAWITFGIETMVHRGRELCDSCCLGPTPNTKL